MTGTLLSSEGCDRATAYHMSNKVVRHQAGIFVTWLDSRYRSMLGRLDPVSLELLEAYPLAQGIDNHCGATLAVTPDDCLHVISGAHATGGFIHHFSATPQDRTSWSLPRSFGASSTYPSVVVQRDGSLLGAYRYTTFNGSKWGAMLQTCPTDTRHWSWPLLLSESPMPRYAYPTNSLAMGPDGTTHIVIEFYKTFPPGTEAAKSQGVTHLYRPEGETTWFHSDGRPTMTVPVQDSDSVMVARDPAGDLRPGNVCVAPDGTVVCCVLNSLSGTLSLCRRVGTTWVTTDLTPALTALKPGSVVNSQGRVTLTPEGELVVATTICPTANWSDNAQQLACVTCSVTTGDVTASWLVPKANPERANWLCSVEQVSGALPESVPLMLYTDGANGVGCVNDNKTDVRVVRLQPDAQ